jgi:hypothetical protein
MAVSQQCVLTISADELLFSFAPIAGTPQENRWKVPLAPATTA